MGRWKSREITREELTEALESMCKTDAAKKLRIAVSTLNQLIKDMGLTYKKPIHSRKMANRVKLEEKVVGKRFGRLVVSHFFEWRQKTQKEEDGTCPYFLANCDCGNEHVVSGYSLTSGLTKSCGCLKTEGLRKNVYKDISYSCWRRIIQGAVGRMIEFDITREQVWELYLKQGRKCALTGVPVAFYPDSNQRDRITASIDRIDNRRGYTLDNIQIIHKSLNFMKNFFGNDYFIAFCNLVAKERPMSHEDCIQKAESAQIIRKSRLRDEE